jgi:hypothetical protein
MLAGDAERQSASVFGIPIATHRSAQESKLLAKVAAPSAYQQVQGDCPPFRAAERTFLRLGQQRADFFTRSHRRQTSFVGGAKPFDFETLAQREARAMEDHPQIGRCNREFLTQFFRCKFHDFAQHVDARGALGHEL